MPLVVDDTQAKHLPANLPKIISEGNYEELPITSHSWFTRQKNSVVMALGGQVRGKKQYEVSENDDGTCAAPSGRARVGARATRANEKRGK